MGHVCRAAVLASSLNPGGSNLPNSSNSLHMPRVKTFPTGLLQHPSGKSVTGLRSVLEIILGICGQ